MNNRWRKKTFYIHFRHTFEIGVFSPASKNSVLIPRRYHLKSEKHVNSNDTNDRNA